MSSITRSVVTLLIILAPIGQLFAQADTPQTAWPPAVDPAVATKPFPGRKVEFFRHGTRPEWGYAKPQQDFFILVHPENPKADSPLYVCLHSAGHDGKSAFEIGTEGAEGPRGHFLYYPPADCYGLYPDCRANGGVGDWWWGGPEPNQPAHRNMGLDSTPCEKRVEDTVRWVLSKYPTDENRVYLTGISMGGSGSLGFGVPRGNLFASILVHVPAGAAHIQQRIQLPPLEAPAGRKYADPPVVVSCSGIDDGWAKDQAILIKGMHDRKYAFIDFWGRSGHDSTKHGIQSKNDLAFSFPWLEIKKNEAYPVFTDATSDGKDPWVAAVGGTSDPSGQINAFFRWKNIEDTADSLAIDLRLLKPDEVKESKTQFPTSSIANVTLRRLHKFQPANGQTYYWALTQGADVIAKGSLQPDSDGLVTISKVEVTQSPRRLTLKMTP